MRIEVHCTSCNTEYVLDEAFAGTALPCPACGAEEGLRVPSASPAPEAPSRQPTTPAAQAVTSTAFKDDTKVEESEEVVCPRCKLHFVPRRATAEAAADSTRHTVLVVEDMDYFREIAAEALSSRFEVKEAATLAEARNHLASGGINLMVLDLTLGGGETGVDLLRSLPAKPCPILIYTDEDESEMYGESWEELHQLGADDILMKGMNVGEQLNRKASGLLGLSWDEDE
jgi:CheY-like chemotaxis protein/DNA-directed RNA polymerase subunit RPC12/RpoP